MPDTGRATQLAGDVLARHQITQPPVDVIKIAELEGVNVIFEPLEQEISGFMVKQDGGVFIGINALHHGNRQRFTLAHELGHLHLHSTTPTVYVDEAPVYFRGSMHPAATQEEVEANVFAASLLMPPNFLQADLQAHTIDALDEAAVRQLSNRYQVSPQALTIRLMQLGLLGGMRGPTTERERTGK